MNICKNCKHFKSEGTIWYSQFCGAVTHPEATDPVTGETRYVLSNDLGKRILQDNPHPYARDVNTDGNCYLYEEEQA